MDHGWVSEHIHIEHEGLHAAINRAYACIVELEERTARLAGELAELRGDARVAAGLLRASESSADELAEFDDYTTLGGERR